MSHELLKLTQEIYSTPHLISLEHFTKIANYLDSRNTNLAAFPKEKEDTPFYLLSPEIFSKLTNAIIQEYSSNIK